MQTSLILVCHCQLNLNIELHNTYSTTQITCINKYVCMYILASIVENSLICIGYCSNPRFYSTVQFKLDYTHVHHYASRHVSQIDQDSACVCTRKKYVTYYTTAGDARVHVRYIQFVGVFSLNCTRALDTSAILCTPKDQHTRAFIVLHDTWRVTQAVDYTYPTGYVAYSSRLALFHNHPHVQYCLLRKQIIVSYRNAQGITCIVSCVVRIA